MKGMLGDALFSMGDSQAVRLIGSMTWSGSIRTTVHEVHGESAATEFTGHDADQIELKLIFSRDFGVEPMDEMSKLWTYMRNAEAIPLTIGNHAYGKYRWVITSISNDLQYFDRDGDVQHCETTVSLQEYLRGVNA